MTKKKVVKKQVKKQEEDCCLAGLLIVGALIVIGALIYFGYQHFFTPKFTEYDCVLNRAGETLQVTQVDTIGETYILRHTQYKENWSSNEYEVSVDYGPDRIERDVSFVDKKYVQVPCTR